MNEEIKKALEELREQLGKNVAALARVDELEKLVRSGEATVVEVRKELDVIKSTHETTEKAFEELRREHRRQAIEREGIRDPRRALAVLGAMTRQALSRHLNQEVLTAFKENEDRLIRDYREGLQRDTLQAGATGGSYLVPTMTETELIDAVEEVSDVMARVDFRPGLPGQVDLPILTARPVLRHSRSTVDTDMTASTVGIGQLQIRPEELYMFVPVDNRLLLMSAVDLGREMQGIMRDGAIEGLVKLLITGTSAPGTFNSILGAAADYRYTMGSGKTAFADLVHLDLVKAKASVLKRGRARGVWLGAEDVVWSLGDKDRTGKLQTLTVEQGEPRLLYKPVVIDEDMPDLDDTAVDTPFLAFGDLGTMLVGLQAGLEFAASTEYLFGRNQTAFRIVINGDIKRKPVKSLVTIRTAAA